jgi:hypothetical protein
MYTISMMHVTHILLTSFTPLVHPTDPDNINTYHSALIIPAVADGCAMGRRVTRAMATTSASPGIHVVCRNVKHVPVRRWRCPGALLGHQFS